VESRTPKPEARFLRPGRFCGNLLFGSTSLLPPFRCHSERSEESLILVSLPPTLLAQGIAEAYRRSDIKRDGRCERRIDRPCTRAI